MNHNLLSQAKHPLNPDDAVVCSGERPTIEMMAITVDRLEQIENQLGTIQTLLFGPEPIDCGGSTPNEPNVRSLAESEFDSSIRILRQCEEIRRRLIGN